MLDIRHCSGSVQDTTADESAPGSPVIRLDGVTKRFQSTTALAQISVTIPPGQFVAIIGRSGAGKTTLLHCLSRGTVVTEGRVRFGDQGRLTIPLNAGAKTMHLAMRWRYLWQQ